VCCIALCAHTNIRTCIHVWRVLPVAQYPKESFDHVYTHAHTNKLTHTHTHMHIHVTSALFLYNFKGGLATQGTIFSSTIGLLAVWFVDVCPQSLE